MTTVKAVVVVVPVSSRAGRVVVPVAPAWALGGTPRVRRRRLSQPQLRQHSRASSQRDGLSCLVSSCALSGVRPSNTLVGPAARRELSSPQRSLRDDACCQAGSAAPGVRQNMLAGLCIYCGYRVVARSVRCFPGTCLSPRSRGSVRSADGPREPSPPMPTSSHCLGPGGSSTPLETLLGNAAAWRRRRSG